MAEVAFYQGWKALQEIAKALGLGDKRITAITIEARGKEPVRVKVEMYATVDGIDGLCTVLREYRLESAEQPKQESPSSPIRFREFT